MTTKQERDTPRCDVAFAQQFTDPKDYIYALRSFARELERENAALRQALQFYADTVPSTGSDVDAGRIARAALK